MDVTSTFCPPNLFRRLPSARARHPCTRRRRSPWKNYPRTPSSAPSSWSSLTLRAGARPSRPTQTPNKCPIAPSSCPRPAPTKPSTQFSDHALKRPCSTHRIRLRSSLVGYVCVFSSFARPWQTWVCLRFDRLRACVGTTGSYTVLFIASSILLLRRFKAPRRRLSIPIFLSNCLLYGSCTAHFALEFNHFYLTLVSAPPPFPISCHGRIGLPITTHRAESDRRRTLRGRDHAPPRGRYPDLILRPPRRPHIALQMLGNLE